MENKFVGQTNEGTWRVTEYYTIRALTETEVQCRNVGGRNQGVHSFVVGGFDARIDQDNSRYDNSNCLQRDFCLTSTFCII